ncbi:MAG: efflux RND transporter periplasmic adaptor subunit [Balneolaceae bacterium]|nr:efflux RND transporter periplasmic adaptor subunit [Balneolaceae bacterium]
MNWKKTLLICLGILIAGGAVTALIFYSEPTASRTGATKETAMLVDITSVERGNFRPTVRVMGTVEPDQDILLSPRVSGQVIDRSDHFTPGDFVNKGDTLLQIDPSDYQNGLEQRRSELRQALSDFQIEMGRRDAALREYEIYGDTLSEERESLVLRKPQLEAARAAVQSAQAAVEQAELNLRRTTITAPFNAHILTRNVNVGSQVAPGDNLGRLVGLDTYWISATVPLSKVRWLRFPEQGSGQGSAVRIRNRTAWEENEYRTGSLYKLVGTLENQTRMARVLITVPDPLAHQPENADKPPLMIGSFVELRIDGRELENVVRLNRDYIRKDNTVWVMDGGKLDIRDVNIRFQDAQYAYINEGLDENDRVVTTSLATVTEGAPLRLESPPSGTEQDTMTVQMN